MRDVKCMGRHIVDKNRDQTTELGPFFVSIRPAKPKADGSPGFVVLSLHGAEGANAKDAFHFAFFPENAERLGNALLDLVDPEDED